MKEEDDDYIQYRKRGKIVEEITRLTGKEENVVLREGLEKHMGKGVLHKILVYVKERMEEENAQYGYENKKYEEDEDIEYRVNEFWE